MTTTTPTATLVQAYLDIWNATEPATRRGLIEQRCTPHVRYVDPLADVTGTEALDALVAGVQQQFPGMRFVAIGDVDAHHDVCRFHWGLVADGAEPAVIGFDVAAVAADGRIATVHGFLDRVPDGA
ncbi:MAG TPA: nuclear transport factor 2 family protein [Pseudonocardia sp.]|nr:nuclear transport factor 2 family protein [Pseudonocardia sp.]